MCVCIHAFLFWQNINGEELLIYQNFQFITAQIQLFQFDQERERPEIKGTCSKSHKYAPEKSKEVTYHSYTCGDICKECF